MKLEFGESASATVRTSAARFKYCGALVNCVVAERTYYQSAFLCILKRRHQSISSQARSHRSAPATRYELIRLHQHLPCRVCVRKTFESPGGFVETKPGVYMSWMDIITIAASMGKHCKCAVILFLEPCIVFNMPPVDSFSLSVQA